MAENCVTSEENQKKLTELFDSGLEIYERVINSDEPASNSKLQLDVQNCINILEKATHLINAAGVFSSNETIDEVPSENIKYLLIPGMLGSLVLKALSPDRINTLETSEIYFRDFLKRYKELKEMEEELTRLKSLLDKDGDDEICRNFYLTYIRKIVNVSLDELNLIHQEKPLAKHLAEVRARGTSFSVQENKDKYPVKPFKPIIITRNELQKKVFGAGYPSLPTMTVDEFYRERVAEGIFPAHGSNHGKVLQEMTDPEVVKAQEETEKIQKENEIETDDPTYLDKTRRMDEFKDTHKRGWGNRMNKS
ncbi:Type 2A phosphatase-associated protein, putative [Pediculus humanus corporis]|uniref:Type 2A phosphatase-associated protein, putative n=1 Tax=Pediculus humanus subsp. corporis TaxID=121224 RepID=E0VSV4_PEDHC|nr:Type 2A phosphatase-associated protein, putative [Pediculus humanus corporis]EEB16460.1 Type 2A phosphatase-associated protein, putative [Pediculus humanus corporis]